MEEKREQHMGLIPEEITILVDRFGEEYLEERKRRGNIPLSEDNEGIMMRYINFRMFDVSKEELIYLLDAN